MSKFAKIIPFLVIAFVLLLAPVMGPLLAADQAPAATEHVTGGLVPCGKGEAGPADCTFESLRILANNVLGFAFWIASIIAAGLIIYAGGRMVYFAGSNPGEAKKAKSILYNVVIGYFVILIAWLVIKDLVSFFAGTSGPLRDAINRVF